MAPGDVRKRVGLILACAVALVGVLMGVLPMAVPDWFVPKEQIEAVTRFFQQSTSQDMPTLHNVTVPGRPRATTHTNNWAVLVGTSKFWFNYRVRLLLAHTRSILPMCLACTAP